MANEYACGCRFEQGKGWSHCPTGAALRVASDEALMLAEERGTLDEINASWAALGDYIRHTAPEQSAQQADRDGGAAE